jgi:signal transduction histidine kinase
MTEKLEKSQLQDVEQEILAIHDRFWKALADRNVEERFSYCADCVTFIGTGVNEKAASRAEYRAINQKGVEQYPHKFAIKISWIRISVIDTMAWVENEAEWVQEIDGNDIKQFCRNTVIFKQLDNKWCIVHVHGSVPDFRLSGDNYMTNSETVKHNRELEEQVFQRTKDLNEALNNLKNAQAQLVQAEKMASLGELTAGIAHEIQNPLNFVNNFSEVNQELLQELESEIEKENFNEVKLIAADIAANEEKIRHHGKRADAIVKGMLQHSRSSSNLKEASDINALADEYLRLAYHGLRAKDKSFNAVLKTSFDEGLDAGETGKGMINIIPQDMGRVLLNLYNNAFYAVNEKKKSVAGSPSNSYEATVSVSTKKVGQRVIISVTDNGNGIPLKLIDKVFQPFFTTKPSGHGTGLGLSLSYDIVKAHGGEINVNSKEGEGTTFIITLPC